MPVNKIIIDNKHTKAERISPEKIQLDLVAIPMDDENDAEPNLNLNLYINGELLKTLQSDENGFVKENLIVNDEGGEQVMIKLEDVISGIQSKIKCVMIEGKGDVIKEKKVESKDRKEIIELVKKNGRNLSDERCKNYINDFDVVMEAVKQNGLALQFASENLKNNYDIVMEAVKQNGLAFQFASDNLQNNRNFAIDALDQNGLVYKSIFQKYINDSEIFFNACVKLPYIIDEIDVLPKSFLGIEDKKEIISAINFGKGLSYKSPDFIRYNKEFIKGLFERTQKDYESIWTIMSTSLKKDKEFINAVFSILLEKKDTESQRFMCNIFSELSDNSIDKKENILLFLKNENQKCDYILDAIPSKFRNDAAFMRKSFDVLLGKENSVFAQSIANFIKILSLGLKNDKGFIKPLLNKISEKINKGLIDTPKTFGDTINLLDKLRFDKEIFLLYIRICGFDILKKNFTIDKKSLDDENFIREIYNVLNDEQKKEYLVNILDILQNFNSCLVKKEEFVFNILKKFDIYKYDSKIVDFEHRFLSFVFKLGFENSDFYGKLFSSENLKSYYSIIEILKSNKFQLKKLGIDKDYIFDILEKKFISLEYKNYMIELYNWLYVIDNCCWGYSSRNARMPKKNKQII